MKLKWSLSPQRFYMWAQGEVTTYEIIPKFDHNKNIVFNAEDTRTRFNKDFETLEAAQQWCEELEVSNAIRTR
jgi:hypothetical protein